MTGEQANTAKTIIFGVTCLAMLGIYAVSCWLGTRATRRIQESMITRLVPPPADPPAAEPPSTLDG